MTLAIAIGAVAAGVFLDAWRHARPSRPTAVPPAPRLPGWALARALGDPHRRLQLDGTVGRALRSVRAYTPREAVELVTPEAAAERVTAIHAAAAGRLARQQIGATT
jgi:hypothetical protein